MFTNNFLSKAYVFALVVSLGNISFAMDSFAMDTVFPLTQLPYERVETIVNYMDVQDITNFSKTNHENHLLVKSLITRNVKEAYLNPDKDFLFKNPSFLLNNFVPIIVINHTCLHNDAQNTIYYVDAINPYKESFYCNQTGLQLDKKIKQLGEKRLQGAIEQKNIQNNINNNNKKILYDNSKTYDNGEQKIESNKQISKIFSSINLTKDQSDNYIALRKLFEQVGANYLKKITYNDLAMSQIKIIPSFKEYIITKYGEEYYKYLL